MMLEGLLYTVGSREKGTASLRLLPGSPVYAAHFPDYPITPGVCLVEIARELMEKELGRPLYLSAIRKLKFLKPVFPGEEGTELSVEFSENGASFFLEGNCCASFEWSFRPADTLVVIPTYNNEGTLADVIARVRAQGLPICVVDDGSTDSTASILKGEKDVRVLRHSVNQGKGAALKTAFKAARDWGFDYVLSLDADGQHFPEDIPGILDSRGPGKLIVGSRNINADGMAVSSSFANRFSNFWFMLYTLNKLSDTQTGFRLYSLRDLPSLSLVTSRYEAELALLVLSAWKGVKLESVPVKVVYPENRVSHFHPVKDFARISLLNTVLLPITLLYGYPRMLLGRLFGRRRAD